MSAVTVARVSGNHHGYPWRASCECGWASRGYAAEHAAADVGADHVCAAVVQLGRIPMRKRVGASVIAPDGLPALFWGYTDTENRTPPVLDPVTGCCVSKGRLLSVVQHGWLWRDGQLLPALARWEANRLPVVSVFPVYTRGK